MALRSLEGRLQLGLGISLAILIGSIAWLGYQALHKVAEAFVISRMHHDANSLVGAFQPLLSGQSAIDPQRLMPAYHQPYSGHYFALRDAHGATWYSRSLWDSTLSFETLPQGSIKQWRMTGPDDQDLLALGGGFRKHDTHFTLVVAEDISMLRQELRAYEGILATLAMTGLGVLLLLQRLVVRRAFRQLQPLYEDIGRLEKGEAGALRESVPTEVLPLVHKLNRLMDQFRRRLELSRNSAGNLAHALKSPLNLMVQQLDRRGTSLDMALHNELNEHIGRIQRLIEHELKRARFSGGIAIDSPFFPHEELPTLLRLLRQMHGEHSPDLRYQAAFNEGLPVDREDMLELLGNLLDNACKWAAQRVVCTLSCNAGTLLIHVEDDGPGCSEEQAQQIAKRGVRLDENVSGHGLGLSIVKDIVSLYRGDIQLGRSANLGGFEVRIKLPLETSAATSS